MVVKKNFVGVVAEKPWQAIQAADKLKVSWTTGAGLPSHRDFHDHLRHQKPTRDTLLVNSKDVDEKFAATAKVVKATYLYPYQMHGSIGTSCAVADVQGGKATIWSATQAVYPLKSSAAMLLGLKPENVHVIFRRGPGCYGWNGADPVSYDAALLSQAVGQAGARAVDAQRRNGLGELRLRLCHRRAGRARRRRQDRRLGPRIVVADHGRTPGREQPGQRGHRLSRRVRTRSFTPRSPAPDPSGVREQQQRCALLCQRLRLGPLRRHRHHRQPAGPHSQCPSPFFTGPLRSPARLQNTFAHESFMDELAAAVKADPVEYRFAI